MTAKIERTPMPLASLSLDDIPQVSIEALTEQVRAGIAAGGQLWALFGQPQDERRVRLYALVGQPAAGNFQIAAADVEDRYPSLTPHCPQAHWFEREIAEQWGIVPDGHPWLKPIRFHPSYRPGHDAWNRQPGVPILPCVTDYFRVEGPEVHEVAVGPVHAGVIEPGHFRFQCHGEEVFHLEISLGYQHRGIERSLIGAPTPRTLRVMETMAGDTSIGHATAYCQILETLAGSEPSQRAQAIRGVALELERLANHTGDLGALADDVGFLPTAAFCGRLRGEFLNATAAICGSRFGRGIVRPGGVGFEVEEDRAASLVPKLETALTEVEHAGNLLWDSLTVQARFEDTGRVSLEQCLDLGLVGPAARACGVERDIRRDFPSGIWRFNAMPVSTHDSGDVLARAYVRALEIQRSGTFILQQLHSLPPGSLRANLGPLRPRALAVGLVEGWRGRIAHVAITDEAGKFAHYKVIDPSFFNWIGLAMALRSQQISDFPLCNKSFNLSYCGHDL